MEAIFREALATNVQLNAVLVIHKITALHVLMDIKLWEADVSLAPKIVETASQI
jgi:hypothetical protein